MPMERDSKMQNFRVVVMGTAGVGKSSIISKFMHDKFTESHKETIEELHRHRMRFESVSVDIDILDTSGSHQFPAMRKLAIATGDAFLLVFSGNDPESFETVKQLRDEIREQKQKGQYSIVVVANKTDLNIEEKHSHAVTESVVCMDWGEKFVTTSAKTGDNIDIVFQALEHEIRERITLVKKRLSFFKRISMPVMRIANSETARTGLMKIKSRAHSMEN
ncbi:ras-related protein Rap-2a-like [Mya arenaria]|uniref:ras-related protein Rap-2a-like n=1 Tax=Mya arenaria TaxID=6604 RepID=UPI0022DF4806|nr:ras-related protein Rap-2a-like [Mya arenaria]XP_052815263.1 ras-related protein Rap-2a-like [Mya arenaria]